MKLFFYDKFFEALIQLPRGIQKKVLSFQKKFRENSKSAGIHLEPISTFKDQSLRSARIDGTYRAIIKAPEHGEVYYLLWVDHHDKAYDWATNKLFQWNDQTQSMQVFTAPEAIEIEQPEEAMDVGITLFSDYSDAQLMNIGVPQVLLPSIREIHTLDDLEHIEKYIPTEAFENLFYLTDGANIDYLIFEIEEGKTKANNLEEKANSINNQRNFIELTDDNLFNEVLSGTLNKWKYYLHPSQRKLVSGNFKGSVKVSGGAGTGKTVAALHRLKYLTELKKDEEKILFTTFTKALTENLCLLAESLKINTRNVSISNLDKLAFGLIKQYEILEDGFKVFELNAVKKASDIWEDIVSSELTAFDADFLEQEYKKIILYYKVESLDTYIRTSRRGRGKAMSRRQRKEIWAFFERFIAIKTEQALYYKGELYNLLHTYLTEKAICPYDYCLVDELQDFSNVELRLIRCLVTEKPNDLFMVGDPMQKIYDKKINFSKVGINIRGKRSRRLRINYRTTEEIKKLAVSIIQDCHYDNFDGEEEEKAGYISIFHGMKPRYELFKTKSEEITFISEQIESILEQKNEVTGDRKYSYSDIAICSRTKDGLKDFRTYFHKLEIPYLYQEISKDKDRYKGLSLLTFHKIKGLEFKHVFLVDVNERTCPRLPYDFNSYSHEDSKKHLKNEKSLLYVAVSRAIEGVVITGVGNKSKIIKV